MWKINNLNEYDCDFKDKIKPICGASIFLIKVEFT